MDIEPELTTAPERRLVALSGDFTMDRRQEIPALWQDFFSRQWQFNGMEEPAAFGVSYDVQADGRFSYAVGRNVEPMPSPLPPDACEVVLSAGSYAVCRKRGSVAELPVLFDWIFTQWLPAAEVSQREGAVFERYPHEAGATPDDMAYEIWVPVEG